MKSFLKKVRCFLFLLLWLVKNPWKIKYLFQWFTTLNKPFWELAIPWIPFEATQFLDGVLTKEMKVFEWGSGGSTLFYAQRVKKIISIEHNPEWYYRIFGLLKNGKHSNCEYFLKEMGPASPDIPEEYRLAGRKMLGLDTREYVQVIDKYPDEYFDLVVVDGRQRPVCFKHALPKVRRGGYLLVDDMSEAELSGIPKNWAKKVFLGPKPYTEGDRLLSPTTIWQRL